MDRSSCRNTSPHRSLRYARPSSLLPSRFTTDSSLGPSGGQAPRPRSACPRGGRGWRRRIAPRRSRLLLVRPRPVERDVLAGATGPAPLEAEGLDLVLGRGRPRRTLAGPDLRARSVVHLDARSLEARRAHQGLRTAAGLDGHLAAPARQVVVELDLNRAVFDPADLVDHGCEPRRPAARLAPEYRLNRLTLRRVSRPGVEEG